MKEMNWKQAQALYVKQPAFISYGAFEETRPVLVDCSLGINPFDNLYGDATVTVSARDFVGYPSGGAHGQDSLIEYITSRFPLVKKEEVSFGAGSQSTISSLGRVLGGSGVQIQGFLPSFVPAFLEFASAGAVIDAMHLEAPEFAISVDALIERLTPATTIVYVDNPNNPTGQTVPLADIHRLATACKANGSLLIVDEAYGDFMPDAESALHLAMDNIICMKSFSKGCGLAGVRLGYIVIKDAELRHYYRQVGLHYSSSAASAAIVSTLVPTLNLPAMQQKVIALNKKLTTFLQGYEDFFVAKTNEATPIILLGWKQKQNLYDALIEIGILTEPAMFFAIEQNNYVRLRCPADDKFELFCTLFEQKFGKK